LLKGTASAVPKESCREAATALPKAGAKAQPKRPESLPLLLHLPFAPPFSTAKSLTPLITLKQKKEKSPATSRAFCFNPKAKGPDPEVRTHVFSFEDFAHFLTGEGGTTMQDHTIETRDNTPCKPPRAQPAPFQLSYGVRAEPSISAANKEDKYA